MHKLLTKWVKMVPPGRGSSSADQATYEPALPRLAFGIAGIALAVATFALSVILPAHTIPGNRESRVLAAAATPQATENLVTLESITVVAARDPGSRAIVRVSSAVQ